MAWMPKPKEGKHYRFRHQEIYATEGMVVVESQIDGDVKFYTWYAMLDRASAFNRQISHMGFADERDEIMSLVESLVEVCTEAKNQGDPCDPEILHKKYKENRRIAANMSNAGPVHIPTYPSNPVYFLHSDAYKSIKL
jgi:hypothetical protein